MNRYNFLFVISMMLTQAASAFDILTAMDNYESGNYKNAYSQFTQLAHANNAEAQYNLGFMHYGGEGIAQDDVKAVFWFEQAAKSGHAAAQDTLAYMYLNGRGVDIDRARAYAWYALAAANGVFLAQNVSESLFHQMDKLEQANASHLRHEFFEKYK